MKEWGEILLSLVLIIVFASIVVYATIAIVFPGYWGYVRDYMAAKDCGTDADCFENAIRNCEPVRAKRTLEISNLLRDQYFKEEDCLMTYEIHDSSFPMGLVCTISERPLEGKQYGSNESRHAPILSQAGSDTRYLNCIYEEST